MNSFKVKELEELYEIEDTGRLWSNRKHKYLKPSIASNGYLNFNISINGKKKNITLHRLIATYFVENKNNYHIVNHIDGNKLNNSPSNLKWCTSSQNNQHAHDIGLWVSTDKHKEAVSKNLEKGRSVAHKKNIKFSNKEGNEMKNLQGEGISMRQIAIKYGTNHHTVKETIKRITELV